MGQTAQRQHFSTQWKLEALYKDFTTWQQDLDSLSIRSEPPFWPEIYNCRGRLHESPDQLAYTLQVIHNTERKLLYLLTYAMLRLKQNPEDMEAKQAQEQLRGLITQFRQENTWLSSEVMFLPEDMVQAAHYNPNLKEYHFFLENLLEIRHHSLNFDEERVLILTEEPMRGFYESFQEIVHRSLTFDPIQEGGSDHPLTFANYETYVLHGSQDVRRQAFEHMMASLHHMRYGLTRVYIGHVESYRFEAKARYHSNALEIHLLDSRIPSESVYMMLDTIADSCYVLQKFLKLKQKLLRLDSLHLYDLAVKPLDFSQVKISYEQAAQILLDASKYLGQEYTRVVQDGLTVDAWIDVTHRREGRDIGNYTFGCYGAHPFIFLNYQGTIFDAFLFADAFGNAVYKHFTALFQPYQYNSTSFLCNQVASTVSQELFFHALIEQTENRQLLRQILLFKTDQMAQLYYGHILTTQLTLFVHEQLEKHHTVSFEQIRDKYLDLCRQQFGQTVVIDPGAATHWLRFHALFDNFLPLEKAMSRCYAHTLVQKVLHQGEFAQQRYLRFLKAGASDTPFEVLRDAGVDMFAPESFLEYPRIFDMQITLLESLIDSQGLG